MLMLEKLREYFSRNVIQAEEKSMGYMIKELKEHFTFRLVVDFRKLKKGDSSPLSYSSS